MGEIVCVRVENCMGEIVSVCKSRIVWERL